jgi:hypothetical protein
MAFSGEMRYMNVAFREIDKARNITSPFENIALGTPYAELCLEEAAELRAPIHTLAVDSPDWLFQDDPDRELNQPLKCVIFGQSKKRDKDGQRTHYAMIISVADAKKELYERIGAAYLATKEIVQEEEEKYVRIE